MWKKCKGPLRKEKINKDDFDERVVVTFLLRWKFHHEGLIVVIFHGHVDDVVIIYADMNVYLR